MGKKKVHDMICDDVKEYLSSHSPKDADYPKTREDLFNLLDISGKYGYSTSHFYKILRDDLKCRKLSSGTFILDSEDNTMHFSELYECKKYNKFSCFLFEDSDFVSFYAKHLNQKYVKKQNSFYFLAMQNVLICLYYYKSNDDDSISKAEIRKLINETFSQVELVL